MRARRRRRSDRAGAACDAVAWSAAGGAARESATVLGSDFPRAVERRRRPGSRCVADGGSRWFREGGGMPSITLAHCRVATCLSRRKDCDPACPRLRLREIARRLGRSPSTISRELRRNAATRGGYLDYRATTAQWHADRRARRPKLAKLAVNDALRQYVQERLAGTVTTADQTPVPGPKVRWIGRRHGRWQHRYWATSWSSGQVGNRPPALLP
jgi:hypothetical protein